MVKKISVVIVLCLLVLACNETDKPKKPENLISKDKMSEVLYDLYIVNAAKGVNRKLLETNGFIPETYVLTKYNIDSTQFADSNTYYAFDIDIYKAIVDKVKIRLEKEKEEYEELQKIEGQAAKRKRDSIKKAKTISKDSLRELVKASVIN
ncbi:DUF4296 domain-containing protein [Winogradskyella sp.]|uniref:DUF4296 domain-containing protein n=1 Tax=Winogradskyella sp. TaxID=1883156 RepID=UPI0025D7584D|nr:DUF4296 domain-containing protein [Winogradskyella sp.]